MSQKHTLDGPLPTIEDLVASLEHNGCPLLGEELTTFASTVFCDILRIRVLREPPPPPQTPPDR